MRNLVMVSKTEARWLWMYYTGTSSVHRYFVPRAVSSSCGSEMFVTKMLAAANFYRLCSLTQYWKQVEVNTFHRDTQTV